ncbi:MAG: transposase [Chloroflexota bacterium]
MANDKPKEKVYVGVDVAKSTLDVAVTDSEEAWQFANNDKGISQADRLPVVVINPRQVRDFARATGALANTDTIDARIIALFGARVKPQIRPLPDKKARDMRSLLARRRQLVEMLTAEHNRKLRELDKINSFSQSVGKQVVP